MLLSPRVLSSLNSVEKISPRIIIAIFIGNPHTSVISCYSPTNVSEEQDVIVFDDKLSSLVRSIPKHNVQIIGGDFNAQLGQSHYYKHTFHKETNRNGIRLQQFLIENHLYCLKTQFQRRKGDLWTHVCPNGVKAQLDFILINKKWVISAHNCEAYNSFERVS